jgi:hypothetical protein
MLQGGPKVPDGHYEQNGCCQFHHGITGGNAGFAGRALSAQQDIAEQRNIFPRPDGMTTTWAPGSAEDDSGWAICHIGLEFEKFLALAPPVVFQQWRQAQDQHVQEAADQGPQNKHPCIEQGCRSKNDIYHQVM